MAFEVENGVLKKYVHEDGITEVYIPENVKIIGELAFNGCCELTSINIPESVEIIQKLAFVLCVSLTEIKVSENNSFYSDINGVLFNKDKTILIRCPKIKSKRYVIPESVRIIEDYAFLFTHLNNVIIPEGVFKIGMSAFSNCYELISINIPDSVEIIEENAFAHCEKLNSINIPENVRKIEKNAFNNCKSIIINEKDISVKIDFSKDSMPYINELIEFINLKDKTRKEKEFLKIHFQCQLSVFLAFNYESKIGIIYIEENIKYVMKYFIDTDNIPVIYKILNFKLLPEKYIDKFFDYTIQNNKPEIKIMLMNYKNEKFGYDDDSLKKYLI